MANTSTGDLVEYIYASAALGPFTDTALAAMLMKARANNLRLGISGMLLRHDGAFLQVLEGPEPEVRALYEKIGWDKRHTNVFLLSKREIEERSFGEWQMGFASTRYLGCQDLEGFSDLLMSPATALAMEREKGRAHQILLRFREGRYHRHVEHDASLPRTGSAGQLRTAP